MVEREDLRQEIILQLWKAYPGFKERSKFSTWMYKVCLNTAIVQIKRSKRRDISTSISTDLYEIPGHEDSNQADEEIKRMYGLIAQLNDIEKGIVMLYLDGYSYNEISGVMGISSKNVSVKLVRIRKKLSKILKSESV
jgi:RNA polymerase sigma-70 factor (ECF subfamily)